MRQEGHCIEERRSDRIILGFIVKLLSVIAALVTVLAFTPRAVDVTRESTELAWDAIDVIEQYDPDYQRGRVLIEKASRRRSHNAIVRLSEAVMDMSIELSDKDGSAREALRAIARRRPRLPFPDYYLGRIGVYNGNYCVAIEHFENAVRKEPDEPEYISWLGSAISMAHFYKDGESCSEHGIDYALRCLSKAARLGGAEDAVYYYRYAEALLLHEMLDEASEVFWNGFHADHIPERATRYMARYLYRRKDGVGASRVLSGFEDGYSAWVVYDRAALEWCWKEDPYAAKELLRERRGISALSQIRASTGIS